MELKGPHYRLLINDQLDSRGLKRVKKEILNKLKDDSIKPTFPHRAKILEANSDGRLVLSLCGGLIGTLVFYGPVDTQNPPPEFLKLRMDILDYEYEYKLAYTGRSKTVAVTATGKKIVLSAENVQIEGQPQFKLKAIA